MNTRMNRDLKSCPCQFLVVQEAYPDLLGDLQQDPGEGEPAGKGESRPAIKFIGVRGQESGSTIMICARESLASGMRLLVFHRIAGGTYTHTAKNISRTKTTKTAVSRIMLASAKMRYCKTFGSGEDGSDDQVIDELRLANVHLNYRTAKRYLEYGEQSCKRFWH